MRKLKKGENWYHCSKCSRRLVRKSTNKYIWSFCDISGKDVRMTIVNLQPVNGNPSL